MYIKLIIVFALAGCLSVACQSTSSTTSSTTTDQNGGTDQTTSTTTTASTEASTTTSTEASTTTATEASTTTDATTVGSSTTSTLPSTTTTTTETTTSTRRPIRPHHPPHGRPGGHGFHHKHNHGLPPRAGNNGIPRLPIISDIVDSVDGVIRSLIPRRVNRGGPGPSRNRRAVSFGMSLDASNLLRLLDNQSLPGFPGIPNILNFQPPNVTDLVPDFPESTNSSDLDVPDIQDFQDPSSQVPTFPGLQNALDTAREIAANEISPGDDLMTGIQRTIEDGLQSSNPAESFRGLISAIINVFATVARNCPFMIVGGYVLREGLILASNILLIIADLSAQIDGV